MSISLKKKLFAILILVAATYGVVSLPLTVHAQTIPDAVTSSCNTFKSGLPNFFGNNVPLLNGVLTATPSVTNDPATYGCLITNPITQGTAFAFFDGNGNSKEITDPDTGQKYWARTAGTLLNLGQNSGIVGKNGNFTKDNSCSFPDNIFDLGCWGRMVSVLLGTALVTLTAWLLGLAGLLFNVLVDHTILNFGGLFYSGGVKDAIDAAWSAFRDIANILIIGIFVFVAISIILGLNDFGQKKMVAKVLIIAVLINFSLLFTKLIIDGSNFTALQFYTATGLQQKNSDTQTAASFTQFSQSGIAGRFIQFTGVDSIGEASDALSKAAFGDPNNKYANANGWMALLHGLIAATFLLVAAAVLLYGCFLLAARALLLVFLMFTASIAFASYLIPRWEKSSSYGWDAWWSSLIKSAVFAPILMVFLWISLKVGEAVQAKTQGGSLGNLLTNPGASLNIEALFSYVVVVGLLFISLRLSSVFAGRIAGFSLASMATFAPIGLASRVAGYGLRQTIGRGFTKSEEVASAELKRSRDRLATLKLPTDANATRADKRAYNREAQKAAGLAREAARYGRYAEGRMNVMDTGVAKTLTSAIGIKGILAGQSAKGTKGFGAAAKAQAEAAAKIAERIAPSNEDLDKARQAAKDKVYFERQTTLNTARTNAAMQKQAVTDAEQTRNKQQRERDDKLIEAARIQGYDVADAKNTARHGTVGDEWKGELQKAIASADPARQAGFSRTLGAAASADDLKNLQQEIVKAVADPALRTTVAEQLSRSTGARESEMRHEEARIESARSQILTKAVNDNAVDKTQYNAAKADLDRLNLELSGKQSMSTAADGEVRRLQTEIENEAEAAGKAIGDAMINGAAAAAREVGRQSAWLTNKGRVGTATEKMYRAKNTRTARVTADLQQYLKEQGDAPTPPTPPPATPPTP